MMRRLAIAGSFASCCFLNSWMNAAQGQYFYFLRLHPWRGALFPIFLAQLAITAVLLTLWPVARKLPGRHWWILLACLVPGAYATRALLQLGPMDFYGFRQGALFWPAGVLAGLILGFLILRNPVRAANLVPRVLLYAWPVLLLIYANAAWQLWGRNKPSDFEDGPLARMQTATPPRGPRVVWIIFDELSRPAAEGSPVFRAFADHSIRALHAQSTANLTEFAMPSLIQGRIVKTVKRTKPNSMTLDQEGDWGHIPNVFDDARRLGRNTGLVGWYHPYCRILNQSLNACLWEPNWQPSGSEEMIGDDASFLSRIWIQARAFPVAGKYLKLANYPREHHIAILQNLIPRGREMARDPELGLVLLHFPAPHPPHVFDRRTGRMVVNGSFSYPDSVVLAGQILQDVLADLKTAGLQDDTVIIVSADHGFRAAFWRQFPTWTSEDEAFSSTPGIDEIPFMVRLPGGEPAGVDVKKPFSSVITRQLIQAILSGRLRDTRQIVSFLEDSGS